MEPQPAIESPREGPAEQHRAGVLGVVVRICWVVQVFLLMGILLWIVRDGMFASTVRDVAHNIEAHIPSDARYGMFVEWTSGMLTLCSMVSLGVLTGVGVAAGLWGGWPSQRSVRSWFAFTALIAAWLAVIVGWRDLAWFAQQQRLKLQLQPFAEVAASLDADWPKVDGEREGIGSFMVYPVSRPTMLMVIAQAPRETAPPILAIEKTDDGALLFALGGGETGVWLERRSNNTQPQDFVGGVSTTYHLVKTTPLGKGWYLSRYNARDYDGVGL